MRKESWDVVVIGCGIVGASTAWHLAERGLKVLVLEGQPGPAMGSTGRSAAGVRVQFTTPANVALSMYSLPRYRDFEARHGFDIGYRPIGYLLLVPEDHWIDHLAAVDRQRAAGAAVEVLDVADARRLVPFRPEGLAGATFGPMDGVIDPHLVTHAWVTMGRSLGVEYRFSAPVTGAWSERGGGWEVEAGAERFGAGAVVNAAGAWSAEVAGLAGLGLPVRPKRVQIFLSAPLPGPPAYPMAIDTGTGVYLRSEGDRILFGRDDPDTAFGWSEGMDWDWLERVLLTGVERFPWWEELGVDRRGSWWGYYGVTPDHNPIMAPHPETEGWIDASGFSGHGVMHAPATGLAVAEWLVDGRPTSFDLASFSHGRFSDSPPGERHAF